MNDWNVGKSGNIDGEGNSVKHFWRHILSSKRSKLYTTLPINDVDWITIAIETANVCNILKYCRKADFVDLAACSCGRAVSMIAMVLQSISIIGNVV